MGIVELEPGLPREAKGSAIKYNLNTERDNSPVFGVSIAHGCHLVDFVQNYRVLGDWFDAEGLPPTYQYFDHALHINVQNYDFFTNE